jgi:hypothetical protein
MLDVFQKRPGKPIPVEDSSDSYSEEEEEEDDDESDSDIDVGRKQVPTFAVIFIIFILGSSF